MKTISWRNATPAQINAWNIVRALIAWTTITPICIDVLIAGSEFLTYNAGKLYLALDFNVGYPTTVAADGFLYTYDQANAIMGCYNNVNNYWDVTAVLRKATLNSMVLNNIWFSRIVSGNYTYLHFNGYRLNV